VDHFIQWARYPDNGAQNFVVADARCNRDKYSFLAAAEHVGERHPDRTRGVARAIYLQLPTEAQLWLRGKEFVAPDRSRLLAALNV
jgi:hypothetical protein